MIVTFNEAVLQINPFLPNDSQNISNYFLFDNLTSSIVRIFKVLPYGSRAVQLITEPLSLGKDRYLIDVTSVEATNGDILPDRPNIVHAFGPSSAAAIGHPTVSNAASPPITLGFQPYWRTVLGSIWQDVAGTVPAVLNNDPIGRFDDLSGLGYHAVQANAGQRPLLKLAVQNGKPGALFDGVDDELLAPFVTLPYRGSFCVFQYTAGGTFSSYPSIIGSRTNGDVDLIFLGTDSSRDLYFSAGGGVAGDGIFYVDGATTRTIPSPLTDAHAAINRSTAPKTIAFGTPNCGIFLGYDNASVPKHWTGYFFEGGITPNDLSGGDRTALFSYSQAYWGTP